MSYAPVLRMFRHRGISLVAVSKQLPRSISTQTVEVQQSGGVRNIVLNDPKTRNCLSLSTLLALTTALRDQWQDQELRCYVLSAKGPMFSSGHNLKHLHKSNGVQNQVDIFKSCTELMKTMLECPVPIVAKVHGLAAAAGCQLVSMCDIVIASETASFSTPGTPGVGVSRAVPKAVSNYMLYTGHSLNAEEALRAGLVSKVVPADKLDEETDAVVNSVLAKSRAVIALGRKFINQQRGLDTLEAYSAGEKAMLKNLALRDCQEGIESFMEKRKPVWNHKDDAK